MMEAKLFNQSGDEVGTIQLAEEIRREVREDVRASIREAVQN